MFCITSRRYGDNANSTDFTTYLNRAVCFFHMLTGCFIIIMNRLHLVECLNELKLDLFLFQQWKQLLLVMKIIGIVKGLLLFVYINNKKLSLLFCKIRKKNRMHLSAVCFYSRKTIMNKLCIL